MASVWPVSVSTPELLSKSRRTRSVLNDVMSTEPSLQTSMELQSEPVLNVLISVCVATSMTEIGAVLPSAQTSRNFPSGLSTVSSPELAILIGLGGLASVGDTLVRSGRHGLPHPRWMKLA